MLASQEAIFSVSLPRGRVSLMFGYFSRVGSCHTDMLLPPSSRVSMTTSAPRPSQLLNSPRSWSSSLTMYRTLRAVSTSASISSSSSRRARGARSPRVRPDSSSLAVQQQLGLDPAQHRHEQLLRERLHVVGGATRCAPAAAGGCGGRGGCAPWRRTGTATDRHLGGATRRT